MQPLRLTLLAFVLAFVGLIVGHQLRLHLVAASPPDRPASDLRSEFLLPDLQGQMHNIREWDGKVIVLNFWATWCPPCRKEIPDFIRLQTELGPRGVQFVGVAIDDRQAVQDFRDEMGINYPLLIGEADATAVSQNYGNRMAALPFTAIINRDGKIVQARPGEFSEAQMRSLLLPLL